MSQYNYVQETGVVLPDTGTTRDEVVAEYKAAFGADLVTTPDTPQGVLIAAETAARDAVARNNAALANQINPNLAEGVFLDAIWALTGGQRQAGAPSIVNGVHLMGVAGTAIPAGSRAQTAAGDEFALSASVTLDASGNAYATFESVELAPIECGANALATIVDAVLGWEAVLNPSAGSLGSLQESDAAARNRRRNTLGLQGSSLPAAITAAVYDVPGVKSLAFRENTGNASATIDGVLMVEHSIYVCVDGGTDLDVATAILSKKSGGCDYNGATTVNVTEPASGQVYPIKFQRPADVDIQVRVSVKSTTASIVDPATATRDAMVAYAAGLVEGEQGFVVGGLVSAFELAGAVNRAVPGLLVSVCDVAIVAGVPVWLSTVPITLGERAVLNANNIAVTVL